MQYRGVHSIVTGGSSGFGRALADRLVDRGSHVSILALDDTDLAHVAADQADTAGTVTAYAVDVGDEEPVEASVAAANALHGPCDLLMTSANIFTDPTTTVLDRLVRMAPGVTRRWLDSKVAGVAKDR